MSADLSNTLMVAVSGRALFNLEDADRIYKNEGPDSYRQYCLANEDVVLEPGPAFAVIKKILDINSHLPGDHPPMVEVVIVSSQDPDTSLRISNSINRSGLDISRAVFTGGAV